MPTTMMTCRATDAPREVEKLTRRWGSYPLMLRLSPNGGDMAIEVTYSPSADAVDPGPSETDIALADALVALGAAQHEIIDLQARLAAESERADRNAAAVDACEAALQAERAQSAQAVQP